MAQKNPDTNYISRMRFDIKRETKYLVK